jgi:tetratricopeptide (TPR) repeat protein
MLAWMGNAAEAVERAERAIRLSPYDTSNAYLALAVAHFHSRNYERSRDAAQRAVEANLVFSVPHALLAASLVRLHRTEDAIAEGRCLLELDPTFTTQNWSVTVGIVPEIFAPFADALHEAGVPAE